MISYLLLAHDFDKYTEFQLRTLGNWAPIFVHVDASSVGVVERFREWIPNQNVISEFKTHWGGLNLVKAEMALLQKALTTRGLDELFDGGIHGRPATKEELLASGIATGRIKFPALIGDSRYDHQVASAVGCDFVFVSGWTEFRGWEVYCETHGISAIASVDQLSGGLL